MTPNQIVTLCDLQQLKQELITEIRQMETKLDAKNRVKEWLTITEVQEIFKMRSKNSVMKNLGSLRTNIGGKHLFSYSAIIELLAKNQSN